MRWFRVGSDNGAAQVALLGESALVLDLGSEIYEAEPQGTIVVSGNRLTCSSVRVLKKMRWNERIARLFASDCAEHVAHICHDGRLGTVIDAARKYAAGKIGDDELRSAWNVARDAASHAEWLNEYSAARAASDCVLPDVQWGTLSATFAAAAKSGSARDEKGTTLNQSLAWMNEREYQTKRLMQYLDQA